MMKKSIFALILASALASAFMPSCTKDEPKPGVDQEDTTGRDTTEIKDPVDSNYIAPGDTVRQKPMVMWIDASANFDRMKDKKSINATLDKAVKYGFNGIVIDVKPCEGTVLYDSAFLDPYKLSIEKRGFDYLEYMIQAAKKRNLRVEISTTIMTMGNVVSRKGPLFTDPEIAEAECIEYTPTGLHKISENPNAFGAVNPCHPNTMKYIKKMIKEILSNYCKDFYDSHNAYDQIIFVFYKEGGRMPWFWNNDDFFDLEYNSDLILGRCFVDKKGCRFREGAAW